ncbi:MAG: hypothetical protein IBJ03_11030 [Gemmatimonadaceae bacterium]|nr:hypothetical protein [Gemmatimonadaceae bacterium]
MLRARIVFDVEVGHQIKGIASDTRFHLSNTRKPYEIKEIGKGSDYVSQRIAVKTPAFETREEAELCAKSLEAILMSVSVERGFAVSFFARRPETKFTVFALDQFAQQHNSAVLQGELGTTLYTAGTPTRFASAGPVLLRTGTLFEPYIQHAEKNVARSALGAARARVAFDLWGSSRSENSSMARLLLLTAAVEAVVEKTDRPEKELAFLDRAIGLLEANADGLEPEQLNRLRSIFGGLKTEGSRSACRSALRLAAGEVGVDAFDVAYELRNKITHGDSAPEAGELVDAGNNLEFALRKLLSDILLVSDAAF